MRHGRQVRPRPAASRLDVHTGTAPSEQPSALDPGRLRGRAEPSAQRLARLLDNARYWIAFDLAAFEPSLAHAPPPIRDVGIGLLLAHGEDIGGHLVPRDLEAARQDLTDLPPDIGQELGRILDTLARTVAARGRLAAHEKAGFRRVASRSGVSAFALRAAGTARIEVEGHPAKGPLRFPLGAPVLVRALDERRRPLPPPEVESAHEAPIWLRDSPKGREILLMVPGPYTLQVPGRALGVRRVAAG